MKLDSKTILTERLQQLHCERLPQWVQLLLFPVVEAEASKVEAKAIQQLRRQVARTITTKTVAMALVAGAPAPQNREGFQGENASSPLEPTAKTGQSGPVLRSWPLPTA